MISHSPLHLKVLDLLRKRVESDFQDGDRFPSDPELVKELGVSQGTVRRALSELVREGRLIRKVPAGTFVTKKERLAGTLAIVAPYYDSHLINYWTESLAGASASRQLNFRLIHLHQNDRPAETFRDLDLGSLCGAIFVAVSPEEGSPLAQQCLARGIPCVSIDTLFREPLVPRVLLDQRDLVDKILSHFLSNGHRRIVLVANEPKAMTSTQERVAAFRELIKKKSLGECDVFDCGTRNWASSYDAVYSQMPQIVANEPTALYFLSDSGAWAALKWFAENNVRVPEDISVIGVNDDQPSRFITPSLSTIRQPVDLMAQQAVAWIAEKKMGSAEKSFPGELILRNSTAPARNKN